MWRWVTLAAASIVLALGITYGSFVAADGDGFGYVSQADLIAHGALSLAQPIARDMPWPFADWTFAPAGYRPGPVSGGGVSAIIVPTYPPGLPLLMAAARRSLGRAALFYVVPVLGALAVWMTFRIGERLHGAATGALAAVLLASSPIFLYQVMQPVSDVPAAAWWAVCLALALAPGEPAALGAGLTATLALLTRPNLVLLPAVVAAFLLRSPRRLALFAAGVVPGCLAVAFVNRHLYGSPLNSGYEGFGALFAWANAGPNLAHYSRWLLETQTPFIVLAPAAPFLVRRAGLPIACSAAVFLSYLFYVPFGPDEWGYLRFLLPALPALLVLSVAAASEIAVRLGAAPRSAIAALVVLVAGLAAWQAREAVRRGVFLTAVADRRYVEVGRYVAVALPADAVVIANLHAGAIHYYSGRLTLRYDWLERGWLDESVAVLARKGYHPYIALDEGEESQFRERFGPQNTLARLDWPATALRSQPVRVRIYDPADRARFLAGGAIDTAEIGEVRRPILMVK